MPLIIPLWKTRVSLKDSPILVEGNRLLGYHYEIRMHRWYGTLLSIGRGQFLLRLVHRFQLTEPDTALFIWVPRYQRSQWNQVRQGRWVPIVTWPVEEGRTKAKAVDLIEMGRIVDPKELLPILEFGWLAPDVSTLNGFFLVGGVSDEKLQSILTESVEVSTSKPGTVGSTILRWGKTVLVRGHDGLSADLFSEDVLPEEMKSWMKETAREFGFTLTS